LEDNWECMPPPITHHETEPYATKKMLSTKQH
jgi:hypothetical protein